VSFLVTAGVGWGPDVVGVATVGADIESPAGYALRTGKPVISNHLENEERFRTPELLVRHGIRRAMNVILQGDGSPYGVLEVDSRSEGEFSENDITFLQGAANILGMAIERQRYERQLKTALDRHQIRGDAVAGAEAKIVVPALDRLVLKALRLRHAMALVPLAALATVALGAALPGGLGSSSINDVRSVEDDPTETGIALQQQMQQGAVRTPDVDHEVDTCGVDDLRGVTRPERSRAAQALGKVAGFLWVLLQVLEELSPKSHRGLSPARTYRCGELIPGHPLGRQGGRQRQAPQ
jgi:GAF domain-containing protein